MGRNELALTEYRKGLEVNSGNLEFHRKEAFHLNRLGRVDEAIVKIESLSELPNDSKAISYSGRIYKEMWANSWKEIPDKTKRLKSFIDTYTLAHQSHRSSVKVRMDLLTTTTQG